jgi:hypothetical protein
MLQYITDSLSRSISTEEYAGNKATKSNAVQNHTELKLFSIKWTINLQSAVYLAIRLINIKVN